MAIQKKQPNRGGRFRRWMALTLALCLLSALTPRDFGGVAKAAGTVSVTCYAAVDGAWKEVSVLTTDKSARYAKWNTGTWPRYYLTAAEAEAVYDSFGFKAAGLSADARIFPNTDGRDDADTIWADAPLKPDSSEGAGGYLIPLCYSYSSNPIHLYYLPNNKTGNPSYFTTSAARDDGQILAENMFYSTVLQDPEGIYTAAHGPLPTGAQYVFHSGGTLTLPLVRGIAWKVTDQKNGTEYVPTSTVENAADGTVTYTYGEITGPVIVQPVTASTDLTVTYNAATLTDNLVPIREFTVAAQTVKTDGSVRGQPALTETVSDLSDGYTVLPVDTDWTKVTTMSAKDHNFLYSFAGWKVSGTTTVLPPGKLTEEELGVYAQGNLLSLEAVWTPFDEHNRITTIHFFISKDCEIRDNLSSGVTSHPGSSYTASVYATRLLNSDVIPGDGSDPVLLDAPPTNADTAYEVDRKLRNSATTPIAPGVTVESFPSDEAVLARLRANNEEITLGGVAIPKEKLTSDHFTIRWAVLKYDGSDGWHIDGILVAKTARFTVTKTFVGDSEAIAAVKGTWSAAVTHGNDAGGAAGRDYTLSLNEKSAETDPAKTGYTSYDAATDTYVWSLDARQGRTYQITESGHEYAASPAEWQETFQYAIRNSAAATAGMKPYTGSGVRITAETHPTDVPAMAIQTVALQNLYVRSGILALHKVDAGTDEGISNVSFRLSHKDGSALTLYRKPGTSAYYAPADGAPDGIHTEFVPDNKAVTDANGYLYLKLPPYGSTTGEYFLEETLPTGYDGATKIQTAITASGASAFSSKVLDQTMAPEEAGLTSWLDGADTALLTVKNYSKRLMKVTAKKNWAAGEDRKPVTVELWSNGAKLVDAAYTQELNDANGWTWTWRDLPLYRNGAPVRYTLRETWIGDTACDLDADPADGFADYLVTYDPIGYRNDSASPYQPDPYWTGASGDIQYATQALLTVNNSLARGKIAFIKVNDRGEPLADTAFALYADDTCTGTPLATADSDSAGKVAFTDSFGPGTYWLKETAAPPGYSLDTTVYKVVIRGGEATIYRSDTEKVTQIINRSEVSLTILKTDRKDPPNPLDGAQFTLTKDGAALGIYSTDPGGTITLPKLTTGTYILTETVPPAGYRGLTEPIRLKVEAGTITDVTPGASAASFWKLTGSGGAYTLTVTNAIDYELPSVGGPGIYLSMLLGTAAMCAAGLFFATQIAGKNAAPGKVRYQPKRLKKDGLRR